MPPDPRGVPTRPLNPIMLTATPALREEVAALTPQNLGATLRTTEGVRVTSSMTALQLHDGEPVARWVLRRTDTDTPLASILMPLHMGIALLMPSLVQHPVAVVAEVRRHPTAGYGMQLFFALPRPLCEAALEEMGVPPHTLPPETFTPWDTTLLIQGNLLLLDRTTPIIGDELADRASHALSAFCGVSVERLTTRPVARD